tara:strand:- start:4064 stop:4744 length:681 start_codon:yes stop_codon:yes gene_type:complete
MKTIKHFLFTNFETLFPLILLSTLSLFILMVRLKITHSFFFLFLVWNLFLAFIPFVISFLLKQQTKGSKYGLFLGFCTWLLFLPNAPYIVTDLIHLRHSGPTQIWLDALMITLFALSGLLCYFLSMRHMEIVLVKHFNKKPIHFLLIAIHFLTGFGIYLGRFLRFNSWDILQEPSGIFSKIFHIICFPHLHKGAWLVTIIFGMSLWFLYRISIKQAWLFPKKIKIL